MNLWTALKSRLAAALSERADTSSATSIRANRGWVDDEQPDRDIKKLLLVIGLGGLSWVATYVGMLELIEANMGDLPFVHKIIIGFSVAMLMIMIIWLLDKIFSPVDAFTKTCYVAGYIFLSVISIGFGFGFYWKVLESRGEATRSAESAITGVQTSLFGAATRLEQLQSTLDQLTTLSSEKSEVERTTGKSCPNSGPGDGPRRKMREEDAGRFKFASDFVKGRIGTVKSDMAALDGDLQKIVKDDRSVIDPRTGNRNEFLRGVSRKLDLTVTGFNAFRTDPQLKQIRVDLGDRAEKTTVTGAKGVTISCPDAQLQMALRGVVRAIDQLPEMTKPQIAAVEGSEATIEAFRRLTTSFFGLLTFKMPPSADELRELQKKAIQSVESQGQPGQVLRAAYVEQVGLAKRDYVPLAVAIFVDLCLLLVSIGRPVNRFVGAQRSMREAENGPVYPILSRFHDIHGHADAVKHFEVFRDVIFEVNGGYHVAVPLNIPKHAEHREDLRREAQTLANLCYALEGQGILARPISFVPGLVAYRQLKRRGSKFVECYGSKRSPHLKRGWQALQSLWTEMPHAERPAFKVYRFKKGAWPEMILGAVMGAARHVESEKGHLSRETTAPRSPGPKPNGMATPVHMVNGNWQHQAWTGPVHEPMLPDGTAFGRYEGFAHPQSTARVNGHALSPDINGSAAPDQPGTTKPAEAATSTGALPTATERTPPASLSTSDAHTPANLQDAQGQQVQDTRTQAEMARSAQPTHIEVEKISGWFGRPKKTA